MTSRTVAAPSSLSTSPERVLITVDEARLAGSNVAAPTYFAELGRDQQATERLLVDSDVMQLVLGELKSIRKAIEVLTNDGRLGSEGAAPSTELRELSDDQATSEIAEYIAANEGETVFPDEVAEALDLDLLKVIEICEALVEEGKIARNV